MAGMIHTTMEVSGMATTRPVTLSMSISTSMVSSSTSMILGKAHTRSIRKMYRIIRQVRRRKMMASHYARAGTRSSLLPITGCLNGTTTPLREILSSSHSG
jgi:hypothetical protein